MSFVAGDLLVDLGSEGELLDHGTHFGFAGEDGLAFGLFGHEAFRLLVDLRLKGGDGKLLFLLSLQLFFVLLFLLLLPSDQFVVEVVSGSGVVGFSVPLFKPFHEFLFLLFFLPLNPQPLVLQLLLLLVDDPLVPLVDGLLLAYQLG